MNKPARHNNRDNHMAHTREKKPTAQMKNTTMDYKKIISQYTVSGVQRSVIPALMKELNMNEKKFWEYMQGQTCGMVNGEILIYPWDIERFCRNLPVLD